MNTLRKVAATPLAARARLGTSFCERLHDPVGPTFVGAAPQAPTAPTVEVGWPPVGAISLARTPSLGALLAASPGASPPAPGDASTPGGAP